VKADEGTFAPEAASLSPFFVAAPSAINWPFSTAVADSARGQGLWLRHVFSVRPWNFWLVRSRSLDLDSSAVEPL